MCSRNDNGLQLNLCGMHECACVLDGRWVERFIYKMEEEKKNNVKTDY